MESFEEKVLLAVGLIEGHMSFVNERVAKLEYWQYRLKGGLAALAFAYLYLFRLSGTLVAPPVTDTGLTFVTKDNVGPYASADSKFEGGSKNDIVNMPSSIPLPPASTLTR